LIHKLLVAALNHSDQRHAIGHGRDDGVSETALLIGCGYLGARLAARLRARGARVLGTRRSGAAAAGGVEIFAYDVADARRPAALLAGAGDRPLRVFYLVPPGLRAGGGGAGADAARAFARLAELPIASAVLASSTAVYGDCGECTVSADTPARPQDERGRRLLAIEDAWREQLPDARIVRLAGLYGPGRVIGRGAVEAGKAVGGDAQGWLNLIYVDDAAALLDQAPASPAAVELGSDGRPARRHEYYGHLGSLLGVPVQFAPAAPGARRASRRCDNGPTRRRTGWTPAVADYRAGLALALHAGT